jgi:FG-GAP-like repeat/PASTA domain/FG-GAP repeat
VRKVFALACLLVLGTSVSAAAPTGPAPSFAPHRSYGTGKRPVSVAIGDLNGDRRPDLATANRDASTVSVLLNRGDGSFRPKRNYATGRHPDSVAIGDLTGDGKPDLAIANYDSNSASVLLNQGDGSFQPKFDLKAGGHPLSVAIGDLNGDGKPDLAIGNSVLLNRGDGSFQPKLDYAMGEGAFFAIGDLNDDRKPDLATANLDANTVSVFLGRGDGSFRPARDYATGRVPESVAIGDLNGDGKPDLATANADSYTVSVLLNRGDGSFKRKLDYAAGTQPICFGCLSQPLSVAIGDLNGDGKPDLATANYGGSVSVLPNRGDGSFQAKLDYYPGFGPRSVAIADLNGDRKRDLATANAGANSVSVLLNRPGLCTVQDVWRQTVSAAKRTLARANCRVGKIRRAYSGAYSKVKRGGVISQKPNLGAVLPGGSKVNLVVSLGRRPQG